MLSRRSFIAMMPLIARARPVKAITLRKPKHPTPRPGITAERVLPDAKLIDKTAAPVFAMVREIPQVVDGIRCNCGCAELEGFYSLLSCYEAERDGAALRDLPGPGEARVQAPQRRMVARRDSPGDRRGVRGLAVIPRRERLSDLASRTAPCHAMKKADPDTDRFARSCGMTIKNSRIP